jgi:hypothetical protein
VGQERREQLQEGPVCAGQCELRGGVPTIGQALFRDLEIVITEGVPEERPEFVAGFRELVVLEPLGDGGDVGVQFRQQPLVDGCEVALFDCLDRLGVRGQLLHESRRVPELLEQAFAGFEIAFLVGKVVADGGAGGPVAGRVDGELFEHL